MIEERFNKNLRDGGIGEELVLKYLREWMPDIQKIGGYWKYWDLMGSYKGREYRFEVKMEAYNLVGLKYKNDTTNNNIAVEILYKGKPSGLASTKADYWVHIFYDKEVVVDHNFYAKKRGWVMMIVKVGVFKEWLKNNYGKDYVRVSGDGDLTRCFVIPIRDLYFTDWRFVDIEVPEYE